MLTSLACDCGRPVPKASVDRRRARFDDAMEVSGCCSAIRAESRLSAVGLIAESKATLAALAPADVKSRGHCLCTLDLRLTHGCPLTRHWHTKASLERAKNYSRDLICSCAGDHRG